MAWSDINASITHWIRERLRRSHAVTTPRSRGQTIHVVIIDGTMSSLAQGHETHAGLTYKLLREMGSDLSLYYEPGIQWSNWRRAYDIFAGRGINRQIRRAYGWLASRYRPGDKIYFMGFSRGAYAVRSLAGMIDLVGLLKAEKATVRNIRDVYRHYECTPDKPSAQLFAQAHCHTDVPIEMVGVWDTVKSLGLNMPVFWRVSVPRHAFHNHALGNSIKNGFHALARDETRVAYAPVLWEWRKDWPGERLVQMWFRGTHGDVGGQLGDFQAARPLGNISFVWLLEQAQSVGLPLPENWQDRFPRDVTAPSVGTFRGFGRWLITRKPRKIGRDPSERIHPSVMEVSEKSWAEKFAPLRSYVGLGQAASGKRWR